MKRKIQTTSDITKVRPFLLRSSVTVVVMNLDMSLCGKCLWGEVTHIIFIITFVQDVVLLSKKLTITDKEH